MDVENVEVKAIQGLISMSETLTILDVQDELYSVKLDEYCTAVDEYCRLNLSSPEEESVGLTNVSIQGSELLEIREKLIEQHRLVLERAILEKEGVSASLVKLKRTKRGMLAYLSQS